MVIRVEVRNVPDDLLIEFLEIGRAPDGDRVVARVQEVPAACDVLATWLSGYTDAGSSGNQAQPPLEGPNDDAMTSG
jgi:hypothetical protein